MTEVAFWWIAVAALLVAEMLSGTLYLLMLAVGTLAAALLASLGVGFTAQLSAMALISSLTVWGLYLWQKQSRKNRAADTGNAAFNTLDVGESVSVPQWDEEGHARVMYRGALWDAVPAAGYIPHSGRHVVQDIRHNALVLQPAASMQAVSGS